MDLVHLHLVLTHFPVAGVIFGFVLIVLSMTLNRRELLTSAMIILVLSALLSIPLYFTGEAAEETVEHLAGVSEQLIEQHEDAATSSVLLLLGLGLLAALGLVLQLTNRQMHRLFPLVLLITALVATVSVAWTSNLGGKIRHSELRGDTSIL